MIINEHIIDYINSLEQELPIELQILEKNAQTAEVPIIRREAGTLLRFLISLTHPKRILEIGTAVGYSCTFMSEYMSKDCCIVTMEKVPMRVVEAKKNLARARRNQDIILLVGDAIDVLQQLNGHKMEGIQEIFIPSTGKTGVHLDDFPNDLRIQSLGQPYDFIFMDAAKAQYIHFLPQVMQLLSPGGLLVTDNILQEGSIAESKFSITRRDRTIHMRMREYLFQITHREELDTVILPIGDGIALSTKKCS